MQNAYRSAAPTAGLFEVYLQRVFCAGPLCRILLPLILLALCMVFPRPTHAQTFGCNPPMANDIVCENSKPGSPPSEWDVDGAGDLTIQGFASDISVNQGQTIYFKIKTDAKAYTIDIYRVGYYGGMGARKVVSITPSAKLPQSQPNCLTDATTSLVDCGNWAVSASWTVPSNATSGIYFAHLIRTDTGGESHIVFVVRNDSSHSDILFQTDDESWEAYNGYGGGSLYGPNGEFDLANRAFKVSYNRPFLTRGFEDEAATWVFGAEFPMVEWLEQNGYDVTYSTHVDGVRYGSLIKNHKVLLASGHDEYWSGPLRVNVEAARDAGVNLAFFTGNEVFWKTRWENSIDGTNTTYRTLVCYKETLGPLSSGGGGPSAQIDPDDPSTWTGTWRDPAFSPPDDGGRPENSLTGTLFKVNGPGSDNDGTLSIKVPAADGKMRFWRNTVVATQGTGQTYTLPAQTLGYEWDVDADDGARPPGLFDLSTATYNLTQDYLLDQGANYGAGTATHHMTMYRAPSGALVFGAGTVQWAWGLNSNHDDPFGTPQNTDPNMQQATVNLLADMEVQPASLQPGLTAATKSTDITPPTSTITSPSSGANVSSGSATTISGTATDSGGGAVAGVEISVDGGTTWHPASGRNSWTYSWTPFQLGAATIRTRAVDDSGNLEAPSSGLTVNVIGHDCPCEGWATSTAPSLTDSGDGSSVEVGVRFRADYDGYITGIRFYKANTNTGTHVGNLWTSSGTLLGSGVFTNETAAGWQQVNFSSPVAISANTTYVASYFAPNGHYSADSGFFSNAGIDNPPIHLLQSGVDGPDGVYSYSSNSTFPSSSFNATNYWVDVVYFPAKSMPGAPSALVALPTTLNFQAGIGLANPPAQSISIYNQGSSALNWTASASAQWIVLSAASGTTPGTLSISVNSNGLTAGNYSGTVTISSPGVNNSPQTVAVSLVVTNVLMNSDFSSETTQGWVPSPLGLGSNWSVANQTLTYDGNGPTQMYAGNSAWTDYTITASFKLSTLGNYPGGLRGRVNPSTGAGYVTWVYPATGKIILYKNTAWSIDSGPVTQLGIGSATFDTSAFHTLQLSFVGSQIKVFYDGNLVISATDSTNVSGLIALDVYNQPISFKSVMVTSNNSSTGSFSLSSTSLNYSANYQGPNPATQSVQLTSGTTLAWTAASSASWLTVSPTNGISPATLQISVSSSSLPPGTYSGTVQVVSFGVPNTTQTINVSLNVIAPPPSIVLSAGSLSFVRLVGQPAPGAQLIAITNGSTGSFGYTVSADSPWITLSSASGSTPGVVNVGVNVSGLATGSYSGNVIISASGITNSPVSIPISLSVLSQDMNESFSDLGNGWIVSPIGNASGWKYSNGAYTYDGQGLSQTCAGNVSWTNYNFDANIQLSSLSNWPGGVRARVNPSTGAGYAVWLYPDSGRVILYRIGAWSINDSSLTQLGSAPLSFDTSSPHDLTLAFQGSQITVSWDGRVLITANDTTYSSGYVCLDADSQPISYSNVRVASVQGDITLDAPTPSSLVFNALPGVAPPAQTVSITAGGGSTTWAVTTNQPWLTATTSSTLTPGMIAVSVNPSGIQEGAYNGTVTIYAPGATNSPLAIPVTLAVKTAVMSVTPSSLNFFGATTLNPNPQTINVSNLGTGVLAWSATNTQSWLSLLPRSGTAPSTIAASPSTSGLSIGSYTDTITVSSNDVANSPAQVSVSTQVGNLLFRDDFSSGAGNWAIGPLGFASGWSLVNGAYAYDGGGHTQAWAGNESWADYTVGVDFKLSSLSDYPGGIRGRVNTGSGAGYGVWIYPAEGVLKLYRIDQWNIDASNSLLGQAAQTMDATSYHNIRLCFQGSTIKVYYDNVLKITATDSTYSQGAIALDVSNQPISFDNVTVISLP